MPSRPRAAFVAGLLGGAASVFILSLGRLILGPTGFLDRLEAIPSGLEDAAGVAALSRRRFLGRTLTFLGVGALVAAAGSVVVQVLAGARHPVGGGPGSEVSGFGPTPSLTPVDDY